MSRLKFEPGNDLGTALRAWWQGLQENKGDRAKLRRCDALMETLGIEAFHKLQFELDRVRRTDADQAFSSYERDRLRAVAALLAQVRWLGSEDRGEVHGGLPEQMARASANGREQAVSKLRFRRLLEAEDFDDLYLQLRRVLALLDNRVDIYQLATDVLGWHENVRKRWAYAYYRTALQQRETAA